MKNSKLQMINNSDPCSAEKGCTCGVDLFEEKTPLWRRKQITTGLIAGLLLLSGLVIEYVMTMHLTATSFFLSVIAVAGRDILKKAWKSLLRRRLDINCLMSIAALGSFLIGHGEEGAAVFFLFFIAELLEDYAADKAKKTIGALLNLTPESATVKKEDAEVSLHTHDVQVGDIIVIRPGEKVPLDGIVIKGHSSINEAPITGESVPAYKEDGDEIYAGTLNEEGYLEARVTKRSENTVLSKIVKLVEEAERQKSATEKYIDKFARYYTPTVIGLAFATFIIPSFILGYSWEVWFYRALVLLVVSCPCALAISTPVAMVSALTSAAKHGVLIKGASFLEELNKVKAVAFDKTGTLTRGRLEVTDIIGFNGHSRKEVLSIAASLESRSGHPVAKAVMKIARAEKAGVKEISGFRAITGKGVTASVDGKNYYAGARNLFSDLSIELPEDMSRLEQEGKTAIFISNDESSIGVVALGDEMREDTPRVIADLKKLNIRTEMLTGDNNKVAAALAGKAGIDEFHSGLLPEDKVKVIEQLNDRFGPVAMVGDGINDAPALAAAGVGIAMGTAGTDVAIETADIALMHDDLKKIDYLMFLSKRTMQIVKQNVSLSILIKGSFTVLALTGLINLWVAVAVGDMGLSLAVILNAMRLTGVKEGG